MQWYPVVKNYSLKSRLIEAEYGTIYWKWISEGGKTFNNLHRSCRMEFLMKKTTIIRQLNEGTTRSILNRDKQSESLRITTEVVQGCSSHPLSPLLLLILTDNSQTAAWQLFRWFCHYFPLLPAKLKKIAEQIRLWRSTSWACKWWTKNQEPSRKQILFPVLEVWWTRNEARRKTSEQTNFDILKFK